MTTTTTTTDDRVLILAPGDNVAIAKTDIPAGTALTVMGKSLKLAAKMEVGHKFAFIPVKKGETVTKYGAQIGVATADIAPGESMHIHNLTSDYIPTYTLDEGHQFFKEGH
jgi:altronate dehydratase small subunit